MNSAQTKLTMNSAQTKLTINTAQTKLTMNCVMYYIAYIINSLHSVQLGCSSSKQRAAIIKLDWLYFQMSFIRTRRKYYI